MVAKKRGRSNTQKKLFPTLAGTGSWLSKAFSSSFSRGIIVSVLFVLAGLVIIEWIARETKSSPYFTVYPQAVRCLSRPAWLASSDRLTAEVVEEIQDRLEAFPPDSIFSSDLEEALSQDPTLFSPWIASVQGFERRFPSQYQVALKLRRPVAVFQHRNRSFFIDGDGVVIAAVDYLDRGKISTTIPFISGFGQVAGLEEGRTALNDKLVEGAVVAQEIEVFHDLDISSSIRVREIDVSNFGQGKPEDVVLITDKNVRLLWGRSSLNKKFEGIDPGPLEKANHLKEILEIRPGLRGVHEVTLTFDKIYFKLKEQGQKL
jgi:hypothetical protein